MTKILMLSRAVVGPKMASPGIRAYQLAGAVGRALPEAEVTLAIPGDRGEIAPPAPNVRLQTWTSNGEAAFMAGAHDVTVSRNFPPQFARLMGKTRLALDAFTPLYIEWMELSKRDIVPHWRRTWMSGNRWYLNMQLTLADFIFCADERQRDMWIGMLMALALVPPDTYERDPSLRRFIDIVPYGVSQLPLDARGPVLRGVVPGIEPGDRVLLWNGGITEWNDAATLLHVMDRLAARRPEVKLVFMGVNHPDYAFGPDVGVARDAIQLARELGLENRNVFFLSGWVPYDRIDDYLAEADASVCLGYENVESRFAFRTRYVDLFGARAVALHPRRCPCRARGERPARDHRTGTRRRRGGRGHRAVARRYGVRDDLPREFGPHRRRTGWDTAVEPLVEFCTSGESYAMPPNRRRRDAYTRGAMYLAMKKICQSPPLH